MAARASRGRCCGRPIADGRVRQTAMRRVHASLSRGRTRQRERPAALLHHLVSWVAARYRGDMLEGLWLWVVDTEAAGR